MWATLVAIAALAAHANGAVIDLRQLDRITGRDSPEGIPNHPGPVRVRDAQLQWPPQLSIGRPSQSVTFWPNNPDDQLAKCGLDAFVGHTAEALLFCSSILKGGTATITTTYTARATRTTTATVITTIYPPSSVARPSSTPKPPTSTPRPTASSVRTPSSTVKQSTPPSSSATPSPTPAPSNCGIVGYTRSTAAYYFDSSGTKNNWASCSQACRSDSKCKSFGYGEANCMLFDVSAADNTNYNPMSPYTFYDAGCTDELPVKKRQINISLGLGPQGPSSACACLIPTGVYATTRTVVASTTSARVTRTETVTRTVSMLPNGP